jgi:hypothetical protein
MKHDDKIGMEVTRQKDQWVTHDKHREWMERVQNN